MSPTEPVSTEPALFIALKSDFQNYDAWKNYYVGDAPAAEGVDLAGPRTVYINRVPARGSDHFPVGTMIVKVVESGPTPEQWQMFAMVKRGGDFDPEAAGWEWFGLSRTATEVSIDWRGVGPPPDGGYGGLINVSCILCHDTAHTNDDIQTPQLQLGSL